MRMRRVACSMTARTNSLAPVSVRVEEVGREGGVCAWLCRKVAQVCWAFGGAFAGARLHRLPSTTGRLRVNEL
jgi:hypothetical protein